MRIHVVRHITFERMGGEQQRRIAWLVTLYRVTSATPTLALSPPSNPEK